MPAPASLESRPSLRAARAAETRAKVFAAATTLFAERGYHATTVDDIARQAQVAKGTFFLHFETKGAAIVELVRLQTGAAHTARLAARARGGARAALEAAVFALGEQAAISRELSRAVLAAGLENPEVGAEVDALFQRVHADLAEDAKAARDAGELADEVEPDVAASMLMAAYLGAVLHFTTSPSPRPLVPLLRRLVAANLEGLARGAAPRGLRPAKKKAPRSRKATR